MGVALTLQHYYRESAKILAQAQHTGWKGVEKVCVCVREREREGGREGGREGESVGGRECGWVFCEMGGGGGVDIM